MEKNMPEDELKEYLSEERSEIERYKWIESEKAGHDLGIQACIDWIVKYGQLFRQLWEEKKHSRN